MKKKILFGLCLVPFLIGCPGRITEEDATENQLFFSVEEAKNVEKGIMPKEFTVGIGENAIKLSLGFFDDFEYDETEIASENPDFSKVWDVINDKRKYQYWGPEAVSLDGDKLIIKTMLNKNENYIAKDGKPAKYLSGSCDTAKPYKYGFFVASLKMEKKTQGHWNAFWACNNVPEEEPKNVFEFDIFEYSRRGTSYPNNVSFDQTTHWLVNGWQDKVNTLHTYQKVEDITDYNTYAVLWTPEKVVYYLNWEPTLYISEKSPTIKSSVVRKLNRKGSKLISDLPMKFIFSSEVASGDLGLEAWAGPIDDKILEEPDKIIVDYFARYVWEDLE